MDFNPCNLIRRRSKKEFKKQVEYVKRLARNEFKGIRFPILVVNDDEPYICATSILEYVLDVDIGMWGFKPGSKVIDSSGAVYEHFEQNQEGYFIPGIPAGIVSATYVLGILVRFAEMVRLDLSIEDGQTIQEMLRAFHYAESK